jgi:hypothetical protein
MAPEGVPIGTELWSKDVPRPYTYRRWTWEQLFAAYQCYAGRVVRPNTNR